MRRAPVLISALLSLAPVSLAAARQPAPRPATAAGAPLAHPVAAPVSPSAAAAPVDELAAITAKVPGVVTLPSGLKYRVVRSGPVAGLHPAVGDAVKVNYEGALASGAVFDSTYKRGKPALLMLSQLVPAWMEALPLMRPGDEWTLYVPAALGYGEEGAGPIPPNSVLVFRIELIAFLSAR